MKKMFLPLVLFPLFAFTGIAQTSGDSPPAFLKKLDFKAASIQEWRLYYSRGNTENSANKNAAVFAISGNKQKLVDLGIYTLIEELFKNLKAAPIADRKVQNDITRYNGNPETISFRWQTEGDDKFYRISIILKEEKNKPEPRSGFAEINISVYANEPTIYLVKKNEVGKLVEILTQFSKKDWGHDYEERP